MIVVKLTKPETNCVLYALSLAKGSSFSSPSDKKEFTRLEATIKSYMEKAEQEAELEQVYASQRNK